MKKETLHILGAGLLGLTIGYFLFKPKTTEEITSSFAGSPIATPCFTTEQFECINNPETKRKIAEILQECGLNRQQIRIYFAQNRKALDSKFFRCKG